MLIFYWVNFPILQEWFFVVVSQQRKLAHSWWLATMKKYKRKFTVILFFFDKLVSWWFCSPWRANALCRRGVGGPGTGAFGRMLYNVMCCCFCSPCGRFADEASDTHFVLDIFQFSYAWLASWKLSTAATGHTKDIKMSFACQVPGTGIFGKMSYNFNGS